MTLPLLFFLGQDAGGLVRREEAALLTCLTSELSFPCRASPGAVLPLLTEHLELTLPEEHPQAWSTVETLFRRAQPWAVGCLLPICCFCSPHTRRPCSKASPYYTLPRH